MSEIIKPIETIYHGYRFRSRLEARWAVFFDSLGVKYEYEPEGFRLSDGSAYLPDFYLPRFELFVEIKASRDLDDGKAETFAMSGDCNGILVCYGQPIDHDYRFITSYEANDGGGGSYDTDWGPAGSVMFYTHVVDNLVSKPMLLIEDRKSGRIFYKVAHVYTTEEVKEFHPNYDLSRNQINIAELAARQARFEHGETPVMPPMGVRRPI